MRLRGDLGAVERRQRGCDQAVAVARRGLPQRHRRRPYLRHRRRAIAPTGDVRTQDRSRERGEMACAGDVRRPPRWDRLRRRFQRSTGGRHEDPARHARRRDGGCRRRRAAGHRPGNAGHEDADTHERAGQGRRARHRHAAARGLGRRPLRVRLDPALDRQARRAHGGRLPRRGPEVRGHAVHAHGRPGRRVDHAAGCVADQAHPGRHPPSQDVYAITGGTGAYLGAAGTMRRSGNGKSDTDVFELR